METIKKEEDVLYNVRPFLIVYKDGTIKRLLGTDVVPPSLDPVTGVCSKDVVFQSETGVSARLYCPTNRQPNQKLPLVIYFHGGAFLTSSTADPEYQKMLNRQVNEANIILVSVNYRLAPENPLPTAHYDSYDALKWVAAHSSGDGDETWLTKYADFDKVFLAGDSAGANITHHTAIRVGSDPGLVGLKISGILLVHPYFWGEEAIGAESHDLRKADVDRWSRFISPSGMGCDDPWINPFVYRAASLEELACDKILVCVAGKDIFRVRGRMYYESVMSKWEEKAELFQTPGEDHVFHILDPTTPNAIQLFKRCAQFINS